MTDMPTDENQHSYYFYLNNYRFYQTLLRINSTKYRDSRKYFSIACLAYKDYKMSITKEQVFEQGKQQTLWAGHLIAADNLSTATIDNYTPINNTLIGQIASGTSEDVDIAVRVARDSFENGEWRHLAPAERKAIMQRWCVLMHEHSEELAALDCIDAGRPYY